jgi:hypothetical protein
MKVNWRRRQGNVALSDIALEDRPGISGKAPYLCILLLLLRRR